MLELFFRNRFLSWTILLLLVAFHLATLARVPAIPASDDGAYAAAAFQFWHTGHPGVPGFRNLLNLEHDVSVFGRSAAAFQGLFMSVFGVSLFNALIPSFLAGLWLLGATYYLGRTLWNRELAFLAILILAASGIFFIASHSARPDLLLACYWVTALYFIASTKPGKWSWRFLLAGLLMGFSGEVHLNGFLLAPIPLLFWLLYRPETLRLRFLVTTIYGMSVGVGLFFWLALHYWPNPEAFLQQIRVMGGQTHGIRVLKLGFWGALQGEIQRYLSWFWDARFHRNLLEGIVVFFSGGWLLWKGEREHRALVIAWLGVFSTGFLFMANPFHGYLIYVWPLFALWIAKVFLILHQGRFRLWALGALGVLIIGYALNLTLWMGKSYLGPPYREISEELRSIIPPKASILAGGEWWFTFYDRDFTDIQYLSFRGLELEDSPTAMPASWEIEWQRFHWQFVVAHGDQQVLLDPEVPVSTVVSFIRVTREREIAGARSFTKNHGHILRRIPTASTPVLVMKME